MWFRTDNCVIKSWSFSIWYYQTIIPTPCIMMWDIVAGWLEWSYQCRQHMPVPVEPTTPWQRDTKLFPGPCRGPALPSLSQGEGRHGDIPPACSRAFHTRPLRCRWTGSTSILQGPLSFCTGLEWSQVCITRRVTPTSILTGDHNGLMTMTSDASVWTALESVCLWCHIRLSGRKDESHPRQPWWTGGRGE